MCVKGAIENEIAVAMSSCPQLRGENVTQTETGIISIPTLDDFEFLNDVYEPGGGSTMRSIRNSSKEIGSAIYSRSAPIRRGVVKMLEKMGDVICNTIGEKNNKE